jgi:RimJ/RimL family protein N-acetyltransferase
VQTERLLLRRFGPGDLEALVELDSDPVVMFHITGGRATPREEIEQVVLPAFIAGGYWAAEEQATGDFVGWFHLRPSDGHPSEEPELGYRLRREYWGRGYATEGCRALTDHAFTRGAERVRAETMVAHAASRRVMEKAGLREVRRFRADWPDRIPGDECGDVEYAITGEEWIRSGR